MTDAAYRTLEWYEWYARAWAVPTTTASPPLPMTLPRAPGTARIVTDLLMLTGPVAARLCIRYSAPPRAQSVRVEFSIHSLSAGFVTIVADERAVARLALSPDRPQAVGFDVDVPSQGVAVRLLTDAPATIPGGADLRPLAMAVRNVHLTPLRAGDHQLFSGHRTRGRRSIREEALRRTYGYNASRKPCGGSMTTPSRRR